MENDRLENQTYLPQAVGGCIRIRGHAAGGFAEETVTQVVALIMAGAGMVAYIIAEGLVDAKAASDTVIIPGLEGNMAEEYVEPVEGEQ